ncbi:MAG: hypothetical protein ACREB2_07130 [Pseudolabrys sp.]
MRQRAVRFVLAALAAIALTVVGPDAWAQNTEPAKPEAATAVKIPAALPPDVAFGRFIALIRGHLLTGDELVKQRDWSEAHSHFMFPLEEIYGVIREELRTYKTPPFDGALKALVHTVAAHNARQYPKALEKVERALAAADADLKSRQPDWPRFVVETAIAVLNTASEEYADAVVKERMVHPVGYRTARGFILQADRMIESAADDLKVRNPDALRDMWAGFAQLKRAFAIVNAPKRSPIDEAAMLGIVSRIDIAARKLL